MKERIKQIWNQLESNTALQPGLFKIRYSENSSSEVFLGFKYPEMYRMLIIRTPLKIGKEYNLHYEFRGVRVEKSYDADDSNFILLNLVLVDKQFKDIFDILIEDIVSAVIEEKDIRALLKLFSNRLVKWQSLFERFNPQGLTEEAQRGLYGEIYFLARVLKENFERVAVLSSWGGPEKKLRDFQSGEWGIEVKTTKGNNHQVISISSERQLDTTNLSHLFLFHLSLDAAPHAGETLNECVERTYKLLQDDAEALNIFKKKLFEAGYMEQHKVNYENVGYHVRAEVYYSVKDKFPRLEEKDIPNGVGDVKYSIIVSQCSEYITNESHVFKCLVFE